MNTQNILVKTEQGTKSFICILKNESPVIYQIVNSEGENNPQSIERKGSNKLEVFFFNGLQIEGEDVFTFTPLTSERYRLGTLI